MFNVATLASKYVDLPLTEFPVKEDKWERMMDINSVLLPLVNRYNQYLNANKYIEASQILADNPDLLSCFFNADKFNELRDAIIAMQRYELNQVDDLYNKVAQHALGINDSPSREEASINAYSASKVDELLKSNKSGAVTQAKTEMAKEYHSKFKATIPKSGWTSAYPFSNTVTVSGVTAKMELKIIGLYVPTTAKVEQVKSWNKAMGFLMMNDNDTAVAANKVTFLAYRKPEVDFTVILEGGTQGK